MTGVNNVISFSVRKSKVKVTLCERAPHPPASPPVSYRFSISLTCGFAFRHSAGMCFYVVHARHFALKGLKNTKLIKNEKEKKIIKPTNRSISQPDTNY